MKIFLVLFEMAQQDVSPWRFLLKCSLYSAYPCMIMREIGFKYQVLRKSMKMKKNDSEEFSIFLQEVQELLGIHIFH